ncbi:type II toxin-antitoxin system RelE/ParE family toxin [Edaphobacter aggregans]|uniref:type II toxin-antitoxin system RelE/ParE family toxin n=1 Tax=Edaphobacter aggregans TaxID=570835 RepID=UPI000550C6FB|nr:type II toxin-antitoxin system RelE/ParE family toxin [Edaphobacter aggregans]
MKFKVELADEFVPELESLSPEVQDEAAAMIRLLQEFGPQLGRPRADTLKGSKHANMKELRFDADGGVWRIAFAFDPIRSAILLVAGDKSGGSQKRFYRELIRKADQRFDAHLKRVSKVREKHAKKRK